MIAMLEAQMPTLRPTAQMQAMDQIRQLRDIERQRATAEAEQRKAQQKADEEALIARAEAESESRSNRDLALAIKDKFPRVAAAVMRGDKDAKEFAYKALENRLQKKDIEKRVFSKHKKKYTHWKGGACVQSFRRCS
jgi:regulator of protease activity HflC (stomatin/prohibitin superfamily)